MQKRGKDSRRNVELGVEGHEEWDEEVGGDGDFDDKYKRGGRILREMWSGMKKLVKSFDGLQNLGLQWMFKQQQT